MIEKKPFYYLISVILLMVIAYLTMRSFLPSALEFRDVELNGDLASLQKLEENPDHALTINPPSGKAESVIGYVGIIAVRETGGDRKPKWSFLGDFRPSRSEIEVVPIEEKLYEGIVTSSLKAGGEFTSFTASLQVDEVAELLIANDLILGYKDNSTIPWDRLRSIPMEINKDYWFVDSAVLTTTSYRKFRKIQNKGKITGIAFGADGDIYASIEGFLSQRRLSLRMFDLRYLRPAQGSVTVQRIGELLRQDLIPAEDANELLRLLHEESIRNVPRDMPPLSSSAELSDIQALGRIISETAISNVPVLSQVKTKGCWATVAAMMYGWKINQRISAEEFLTRVAPQWLDRYEKDLGLSIDEAKQFVDSVGLSFEYGQSYLPIAIEQMLADYGPLWFTVGNERGINTHANLVTGLRNAADGKTYVSFIDPSDGRWHDEEYSAFMHRYEDPAYLYNRFFMEEMVSGQIIPMHVVHY